MSCCFGGSQKNEAHNAIQKFIAHERKQAPPVRTLLLGAGNSGKTTFLKQLVYTNGKFEATHVKALSRVVRLNLIQSATALCELAKQELQNDEPYDKYLSKITTEMDEMEEWDDNTIKYFESIWAHEAIQTVWRRNRRGSNMLWCTDYLFDNCRRIAGKDYEATRDDILRARIKTTGVKQTRIQRKDTIVDFVDVGGQRSERRKWLHCFDGVHAIIFLAALDDFLVPESTGARAKEILDLFQEVTGNKALTDTETIFILYLNKVDLFKEKFEPSKLQACLPNATNVETWQEGVKYIAHRFHRRFSGYNLWCTHVGCALYETNCKRIFHSMAEAVLEENMRKSGMELSTAKKKNRCCDEEYF